MLIKHLILRLSVVIPDLNITTNGRMTVNLAVQAGKLMANLMALDWAEEVRVRKVSICLDSSSTLPTSSTIQILQSNQVNVGSCTYWHKGKAAG